MTLAAAKDFLRIGHEGEDELVVRLLQSARARIEQAAGLALVEQTLRVEWGNGVPFLCDGLKCAPE